MVLILRTQAAQDRLEGRPNSIFGENDYAVCDDRRVGRIYFAIHVSGPDKWAWFLANTEGLEVPVQRSGYAVSLEAAKAELAEQYRRWQASSQSSAGHQQGPATGQGHSSGRG
jgi:hypothetical protein